MHVFYRKTCSHDENVRLLDRSKLLSGGKQGAFDKSKGVGDPVAARVYMYIPPREFNHTLVPSPSTPANSFGTQSRHLSRKNTERP